MRFFRPLAVLATLCLLAGPNAGCLSLSMLNHEAPDTKDRLDALENRVSALEGHPGAVTISAAGTPTSTLPGSFQHVEPPPTP